MIEAKADFEYQVGGSLESQAPSYVTRQADSEFYEGLKAGQFCYVLNSRQMGKSSLRVRTMQRLLSEGTMCVYIDLTGIGKQDVTPEKWYAGIVQSLVSSCQLISIPDRDSSKTDSVTCVLNPNENRLSSKIQWRTWWRFQQDLLSPVQRLSLFIEEVLLVEVKQNIVIFVDEIDRVLSQDFSLDDFFALIRFFYGQREVNPEYKRLTFALLGVATPSELIQDKTQTPFNIGKAIELRGFQPHEVQPLIEGLKGKVNNPDSTIAQILGWTGGQPFLTQKLCRLMVEESRIENPPSVEQVVLKRIIENWESQDEPEHLRTIRDRICYRNKQQTGRLLGLYKQILQQGEIIADRSSEQMELRLSGLVVEQKGKLKVYNRIYEAVFDRSWVDQKLAELRPYAKAIVAWKDSNCQDEACLLRGQALHDALAWALGKSLSDLDYQFLVASQDLARRQAQTALEALSQASQILAAARQKAQVMVLKWRIGWGWMPLTAACVTAPILLLRFGGLLQGIEWDVYDQFFRWRPQEPPQERITIVTINEADIAAVGKWPIPDHILTTAIANIKAQQPRAIGLDIYRDLPVEPGYSDLVKLFNSTPNLFGIEKVVGNIVAPHPILSKQSQVGFADQVLDADSKVRRGLLSVTLSENEVHYSLALKLALHYLEAEGITPEAISSDDRQSLRLGKAVFERFEENDGGYVRAQSGGYQILLNFVGPQASFPTFSLREVLKNQIPPDSFRDRLVLIGMTAESLNDFFHTPYSGNMFISPNRMAGVTVHANIISQIISAALDGRPLLRVWDDPIEWLWILAMSGIGAAISWQLKSSIAIAASILLASGGLLGVCYLAFLLGWWLPVVPSLLALLGSAVALPLVINKQLYRLRFRHTLALLLKAYQDNPTTGRIAIEYLKQSESQENQVLIEQQLRGSSEDV